MQTKCLRHVACDTDIHPRLIVKCAALRMCLRPCREEKICLNEVYRFVWGKNVLRSGGIDSLGQRPGERMI
jgi:hypothetical protein